MNNWSGRALVVLLCGFSAGYAFAECDVEPALARLQQEVTGTLTHGEQERARLILADLCVSLPTESPTGTPVSQEAETTRILGIEFRKADPDSKGHDRLKK